MTKFRSSKELPVHIIGSYSDLNHQARVQLACSGTLIRELHKRGFVVFPLERVINNKKTFLVKKTIYETSNSKFAYRDISPLKVIKEFNNKD
jgi:hypothetical protein